MKEMIRLLDIIDINDFQSLQDDIALSTDMALLTVDYKGVPVTEHSSCQSYCHLLRQQVPYQDLCQKCDSRGGLEAARLQKPYIYICHRGIVDLAVPIIANNQYLGALMAGQVRISDDSKLEWIAAKKEYALELEVQHQLEDSFEKLPVMTYEKIEAIGNLLFGISKVLVDRALLKLELDGASRSLDENSHRGLPHGSSASASTTSGSAHAASSTPSGLLKTDHIDHIPTQYLFLKPAIEFLHQHLSDKVYIEEVSALCNISESYFSKCFNKAFGMSFSAYQNRLKLLKAEELITTTNKNINQISDELGYENASYFIRVFKKEYNVTPAMYKQRYIEKTQFDHRQQPKQPIK